MSMIVEVKFPSKLKPGTTITGTVTAKNPTTQRASIVITVTPQWNPNWWMQSFKLVDPDQTVTFKFPDEFSSPTISKLEMPEVDAVLRIEAWNDVTSTTETVTITIKVETPLTLTTPVLGLPIWAWLLIIIGGTAGIGVYMVKKGAKP